MTGRDVFHGISRNTAHLVLGWTHFLPQDFRCFTQHHANHLGCHRPDPILGVPRLRRDPGVGNGYLPSHSGSESIRCWQWRTPPVSPPETPSASSWSASSHWDGASLG